MGAQFRDDILYFPEDNTKVKDSFLEEVLLSWVLEEECDFIRRRRLLHSK
jgi:hypothetical protein